MFNSPENPLGFQQITDLTAAATFTAGANKGASIYLIQAQNFDVKFRDDGTDPTSVAGITLVQNSILEYTTNTTGLKFITAPEPDAGFAISTNFDVANVKAIAYKTAGITVTLSAATVADTGTAKTIAADQWAGFLMTGTTAGTLTGTFTADAATEAAAVVLVKALTIPSGEVPIGYVTILTDSGNTWTAGTDALQGGTGGNVSDDTNYFNYRAAGINIAFYGVAALTQTA